MRILLVGCLMIPCLHLFAQSDTVVVFYDRDKKVCEEANAIKFALQVREGDHYKKIMADMMDNKVESIAYFSDRECKNFDGPYKEQYKNGRTKTTGYYSANKKINGWKAWNDDGILTDSLFYVNGFISGIALSWDKNGVVTDSLVFENDGNGIGRGYWSNRNLRESGSYKSGKKDGMWTYYYETGKKCQEVNYVADSAVSFTCYDENESIQKKECVYEREASFPGGDYKWVQYLSNKISAAKFPNDYYKGKIYGEVWIQFIVDIDGSIVDAKIIQSAEPSLDEIALNVITKSPKWQHAVQYNRPVKAYRRQPITFPRMTN
ncbi:MAG TPA: energy transducer TonB [Chitinophagaceae bacterium]|jgi:TonB family protein|nr:energy transducer TonB [Chitinophagaceae bacterium]